MDNDEQRDHAEEAANAALLTDPDPEPDRDVRLSKAGARRFRQLAFGMPYGARIGGAWRYLDPELVTVADVLGYLDELRERLVDSAERGRARDEQLRQHEQFASEVRRVHGVLTGEYTVQSVYGVEQ